jgi:hypothetical protein
MDGQRMLLGGEKSLFHFKHREISMKTISCIGCLLIMQSLSNFRSSKQNHHIRGLFASRPGKAAWRRQHSQVSHSKNKNSVFAIYTCSFGLSAPGNSTFLSEQSNQPVVLFSQNKSAPATNRQPNEQAARLFARKNNFLC